MVFEEEQEVWKESNTCALDLVRWSFSRMSTHGSDVARPPSSLQRAGVIALLISLVVSIFLLQCISVHVKQTRKKNKAARRSLFRKLGLDEIASRKRVVLGFFHPYCNAGGGGERVLWQAVQYHLQADSESVVVIYSGDVDESASLSHPRRSLGEGQPKKLPDGSIPAKKGEILAKCKARFGIPLDEEEYSPRIWFLPLQERHLISDSYWKRFTLLGQSYGGARLAIEACSQLLPDVWIDTMGHAFTYPIVKLFDRRIAVGGYIHYPVISTDMLKRVKARQAGHTNASDVSKSAVKSKLKVIYYQIFASLYSWSLRRSDSLVANGTWTQNHLNQLIFGSTQSPKANAAPGRKVEIVYPPCDTGSLASFSLSGRETLSLVSLAQFRPEKEHKKQLLVISEWLKSRKEKETQVDIHLCCMGSSRNEDDEQRIVGLQKLAKDLNIEILEKLSTASIGLSTMVDEHFGINVVEFMAAGLITLSHASAGPLLDIAVPSASGQATGFHADTVDEFVSKLEAILSLDENAQMQVRSAARARAIETFSNEAFCRSWEQHLASRLLGIQHRVRKVQ